MSRLPSLPPQQLEGDQKAFYDELSEIVTRHFGNHFTTKSPNGAFIGPFGIFMHTPVLGRPFFDLTLALSKLSGLPVGLREIAILTVGAHFGAKYELYAHENVARSVGVGDGVIEQIRSGKKPGEFEGRVEGVVYDVARALVGGKGALGVELYERAVVGLGVEGTVALVQFVGFYAYTCVVLNGFDVSVPTE